MLAHEYVKCKAILDDYLFKQQLGIKDYKDWTQTQMGYVQIAAGIMHFKWVQGITCVSISFHQIERKYAEAIRVIEGP